MGFAHNMCGDNNLSRLSRREAYDLSATMEKQSTILPNDRDIYHTSAQLQAAY